MNTLITLLMIQVIVVCLVDLSGIVTTIKKGLSLLLTKGKVGKSDYQLKPLDCSLCMTFWSGIVYLLCSNCFSIQNIMIVCLLAVSANITKSLFLLLIDLINWLIATIQMKL